MHSINTSFSAMVPIGFLLLLGLWTTGSCGQDSCTCEVATNCGDPCPYMTGFVNCLQQFCDVCGGESHVTSTCQDTLNSLENKCGTDCGLEGLNPVSASIEEEQLWRFDNSNFSRANLSPMQCEHS
jgi:hypothetical protein